MILSPREAAASYLARGWQAIPVKQGTKEPAVKFKQLATADYPSHNFDWFWQHQTQAGVAILMRPSGLLVVDCDSRGAVLEAIRNTPEPCNNIVLSTKGAHFYYRRPADTPPLRTVKRGASQAIDILADGYMVAPPSVHPSGHRYEWAATGPLQDAPDWACGLLAAIRERSIGQTHIDPHAVAGAFPASPQEAEDLRLAIMCRDARVAALLSTPTAGTYGDRSHRLWLTINTMIRLLGSDIGPTNHARDRLKNTIGDLSDESIAKVIWFGTLGSDQVGDKPRERGWQWFCDEIARARCEIVAK